MEYHWIFFVYGVTPFFRTFFYETLPVRSIQQHDFF